ncbi:hypothetical protein BAZOLSSOX_232 [uncultured Gammaproteobacteria bacterium]|nr:hypothetical protein [uncultured Gammaproteobacteria bacterium]VVH60420.1 hypothetical protein BAZOLSSOX_232 [uncultured Gammaproteobacteria bacterium]
MFYLQKIHHHTGGLEIYISSGGGSVFYSPPHRWLRKVWAPALSCHSYSPPHRWLRKIETRV